MNTGSRYEFEVKFEELIPKNSIIREYKNTAVELKKGTYLEL